MTRWWPGLADRRLELHHGKIAAQEVFAMADEEQFDEVLEELWVLAEHGEIAELGHMEVHGALPVSIAVEKMTDMGLVSSAPHPPEAHHHRPFINPCHDALKPTGSFDRRRQHGGRTHPAGPAAGRGCDSSASSGGALVYRQLGDGQRNRDRTAGLQVRAYSFARSHRQDLHFSRPSANLSAWCADSAGGVLRTEVENSENDEGDSRMT